MDHDWSPKPWQRFVMGYNERFVDDCILPLNSGNTVVRVAQAPSARQAAKKHGYKLDKDSDPALTGTTVWDGAVVLSQYLTATSALRGVEFQSKRTKPIAIELGAGTAAVSMALLACHCVDHITITDLPDVLPHIRHNLQYNSSLIDPRKLTVQPLRWAEATDVTSLKPHPPPFDLIVGSDLIYYTYSEATPHSKLLITALQQLSGPETLIFLALSLHHNPEEVEHFLGLASAHFSVQRLREEVPEEWRVPDVMIVKMQQLPAR